MCNKKKRFFNDGTFYGLAWADNIPFCILNQKITRCGDIDTMGTSHWNMLSNIWLTWCFLHFISFFYWCKHNKFLLWQNVYLLSKVNHCRPTRIVVKKMRKEKMWKIYCQCWHETSRDFRLKRSIIFY